MAPLSFNTYWNDKQKRMFEVLLNNENWITDVWYGWWAWWGKSYWWVAWQWMMRNRYPWTRGFLWRKELKRLKQTTLLSYFKFCNDYGIPQGQRGTYNAQNSEINFANGSQILLLDLSYMPSDPMYTRFWSLELTDWFADEIAEIDDQCLMILKTRIGRQMNDEYWLLPKFLGTFNPDKWHVYRNYYKAAKDGTLPDYRIFIPALATDNKKLPTSYIDQLRKADNVTQQRLLYWNFEYDDTPWRLMDYAKILDMLTNPKYNGEKYISCDVARKWKDKAVISVWDWYEEIDRAEFWQCLNVDIENKIKEFAYKYNVWMSNTIVDEDWWGNGIVDHLACKGFINGSSPIQPYAAKNDDTQKVNFANLKTQCYFELAKLVNNNKIKALPENFDKLAEELDVVVEIDLDKDGKKKIISKEDIKAKLWRSPDYSDTFMMRCYFEINKWSMDEEDNDFFVDFSNNV